MKLPTRTPSGALVEADDEQHRRADGDQHVREARDHEADRALLDAEERGQLLVVHLRPEPDGGGADEAVASSPSWSACEIGAANDDAGDEAQRSRSPS